MEIERRAEVFHDDIYQCYMEKVIFRHAGESDWCYLKLDASLTDALLTKMRTDLEKLAALKAAARQEQAEDDARQAAKQAAEKAAYQAARKEAWAVLWDYARRDGFGSCGGTHDAAVIKAMRILRSCWIGEHFLCISGGGHYVRFWHATHPNIPAFAAKKHK